jgi:hypothetical protein
MTIVSSWANNCAANNRTNGVDLRLNSSSASQSRLRLPRAALKDFGDAAVGLPGSCSPTLTPTNGSTGVIKSFILPGNKTGVVRLPSPSAFSADSISLGW